MEKNGQENNYLMCFFPKLCYNLFSTTHALDRRFTFELNNKKNELKHNGPVVENESVSSRYKFEPVVLDGILALLNNSLKI